MEAKELTSQQRIMILEDVLQKLESGNTCGGLCIKIEDSVFKLLQIQDYANANEIIPLLTLENAKRVTEVKAGAHKKKYWWNCLENYDFENRIKFVKWMINKEKEFLK